VARYYRPEHEDAYRRIEREGKASWDELHGGSGFDDFASRAFLEQVLPTLGLDPSWTEVLEYGCGTGPGACFLAARGFRVDAVDLVARAIRLARRFAAERGLTIEFRVQDVCALAGVPPTKQYDLIVDSYCLQSIVTDADRSRLFAAVRARLKPGGRYLISTAMQISTAATTARCTTRRAASCSTRWTARPRATAAPRAPSRSAAAGTCRIGATWSRRRCGPSSSATGSGCSGRSADSAATWCARVAEPIARASGPDG